MSGIIYKYTYLPTGESYIGQTTNFSKRQKQHLKEDRVNLKFHNLLRKHYEDFTIEILEDNIDINDLNKKEKYYIQKYNSYKNGFNLTQGGDGNFQACNNYWKQHPEKMKEHIKKIQPLAAQASKQFWEKNPEWKKKHLEEMKNGWNEWYKNNKQKHQNNLKQAHLKAKEWRQNNPEQFQKNRQKAVNATKKPVELINTGEKFESASAAARYYNLSSSGISACCRGTRKSCGRDKNNKKMVWRYINKND